MVNFDRRKLDNMVKVRFNPSPYDRGGNVVFIDRLHDEDITLATLRAALALQGLVLPTEANAGKQLIVHQRTYSAYALYRTPTSWRVVGKRVHLRNSDALEMVLAGARLGADAQGAITTVHHWLNTVYYVSELRRKEINHG